MQGIAVKVAVVVVIPLHTDLQFVKILAGQFAEVNQQLRLAGYFHAVIVRAIQVDKAFKG
ncbi:MAG: hypothetical protein AUJ57_04735 [Zetaproteobacteria bacterium CG1_02_53_45]|nr:MAG: hypothetical protein AUJ57_04735 [Zetaproteobacteria bacterium CG1_02_53_45]